MNVLHVGANLGEVKVVSVIFEWVWSKIDLGIYLVHETLKPGVF